MSRKQYEAKYPKSKVVTLAGGEKVTMYRSYDRKGEVIYVTVPE